ncbi:hypothetical protein LJC20_05140 [Eubacteriales bacterium OttesenSCG-928-M02]|nr:hypothetical protein [Eubacteriales bacterium OttesenSCG-928-M02]
MAIRKKKGKLPSLSKTQQTANELVNIKDIVGYHLYTKDGFVFSYIKVNPINADLMSKREIISTIVTQTAELSSERNPLKLFFISRPVSIDPLLDQYTEIYQQTDDLIRKKQLRESIMHLSNLSMSGDNLERQFYVILWAKMEDDAERDLFKRCNDLMAKLTNGGFSCELCKEAAINGLVNLYHHLAYSQQEDTSDIAFHIPSIGGVYEEATAD